ncbi:Tetratricopeptide repeat-containing domain [Macleaya cordata]|uniref:Tetratricopeptide repeat-containing domain n=1 Tax=Macleaya cordata TaxID=56857 RepID=A0A200QBN5_MACCD|nr:Tetratricopeptide repeat-containing domain [Macleaya cordata]
MDSLSRGALIHGVTFSPSNPNRTTQKSLILNPRFPSSNSRARFSVRVSSSFNAEGEKNPIIRKIKNTTGALILTVATALMIGKFSQLPARAESPPVALVEEEQQQEHQEEEEIKDDKKDQEQEKTNESPLSQFIESHSEAIDALKSLLQDKLESGEDEEALTILKRLVSAQPSEVQWKFMMARVLNELGETAEARKVFDEILSENPLSFEALLQNALLMDQRGEGEAVIRRLEEALKLAEEENKDKEARDVRFIIAQVQFLQKNVDEALKNYQELANEDPKDYRPYFCQGVIYTLLDRNKEAKEQFAKCHELSPEKFEVKGYLQTPLSRTKLFATDSDS